MNQDWNTLSGEEVPNNNFVLIGLDGNNLAGNKMINVGQVGRKMNVRRINGSVVDAVIRKTVAGDIRHYQIMKELFLENMFTSMGQSKDVLRDDIIEYMAKLKPGKSISLPKLFNLRLKRLHVKNDPDTIRELRDVFKDIVAELMSIGGVGGRTRSKGRRSGSSGKGRRSGSRSKGRSKGRSMSRRSGSRSKGRSMGRRSGGPGIPKTKRGLGIAGRNSNGTRKNKSVRVVENNIVTRGPSLGMGGQLRAMADAQRLEHARMVESQERFNALPCEAKLEMAMNRIMDLEEELSRSNEN
jgi:hypothetical protein